MTSKLGPRPVSEWSDEELAAMRGHLERANKYLSREPGTPPLPALLGLFGQHPKLSSAYLGFSGLFLDEPAIPPRDREISILRLAHRSRCHYEWAQHVAIGINETGLTDAHIDAVVIGADAEIWTDHERAVVAATDELIDDRRVSDKTYAVLAEAYDGRQILEFLFCVGSYLALALVINSVDLPADGATPPPLREEKS